MAKTNGSLIGAILLLASCAIGAAMLGLPVLSAEAGFFPSVVMFTASWLFMMVTGLLLLEVNLWFKEDVSIISMAGKSLGKVGQGFAWVLYLYLFYSILVAYVAGTGTLVAGMAEGWGLHLEKWVCSLAIVLIFGVLIYFGTYAVDIFNRICMVGLIAAYFVLLYIGAEHIETENLTHMNWGAVFMVVPSMIISFGYHNLVPTMTSYLGHDRKRLVKAIVIGSLIPLVVYLLWEGLILGIVPFDGFRDSLDNGHMATHALKSVVNSPWVILLAEYFALFAVITSLVGVAISFVDFLADGLHIKKTRLGKLLLCTLSLLPPFICAMAFPGIFLMALGLAGAFGAVILFGVLPGIMVWKGRYRDKIDIKPIVPGGKIVLMLVIFSALLVTILELIQDLGGWLS